jgi:uncharacterized protein YggU (UPF0235/DUF167 family)
MLIKVKVRTRARRESVTRLAVDIFEMEVREFPENNQANLRVLSLLSLALRVPAKTIRFVRGQKSPSKLFEVFTS